MTGRLWSAARIMQRVKPTGVTRAAALPIRYGGRIASVRADMYQSGGWAG